MEKTIYLDHCGTTPLSSKVKDILASEDLLSTYGNPSATHHDAGAAAAKVIEKARETIGKNFGVDPQKVIFTSGASEANNIILLGFWLRFRDRGCRIIYSAIEHKSVLEPAKQVGDLGKADSLELPVNASGLVDLEKLKGLLSDNPRGVPTLVCVMHTNNEIPVRQPIEEVARLCEEHRAYFHCDAVQGFVREKIRFQDMSYGSVVISAHKVYGPKGVGVLLLGNTRTTPLFLPPYLGGEQEFGLRPGSHNTLAIRAAEIAISLHEDQREALLIHLKQCDRIFTETMSEQVPGFHLTVEETTSVPGIVNFYIDQVDAPSLLLKVPSVCLNRGASCMGAGGEKYSHVPKALGLPVEIQANVLRASFGFGCTIPEIKEAVLRLAQATRR